MFGLAYSYIFFVIFGRLLAIVRDLCNVTFPKCCFKLQLCFIDDEILVGGSKEVSRCLQET